MKPNAGKLAILVVLVAMLNLISPTDVAFAHVDCIGGTVIALHTIEGTSGPDIIDCRGSTHGLTIGLGWR